MTITKQIYLLCCFIFFDLTNSFAQKIEVSEQINIGREVNCSFVAAYDTTVLMFEAGKSKHHVRAFGFSLGQLWRKEVDYPGNNMEVLKVIPEKEYFTIIYILHKKGKTEIRAKELDAEAKELSDFEIGTFLTNIPNNFFEIVLSEDKKQVLVYAILPENHLNWISYDLTNKQMRWTKEKSFSDVNYLRDFNQVLINNGGSVYMILEYDNVKRKRNTHRFVINHIAPEGEINSHQIPFSKYLTYACSFVYDELNRQLVAGGLYADGSFNAHGLFYLKSNLVDAPQIYTNAFDEVFIRSLTGAKRKKLDGISNLEMNDIILRRDGGIICVAEQNFKFEYQLTAAFYNDDSPNRQADYLFENVLLASIHPNGELHWKDVLYKSQSSENDNGRYSSYFLMKTASNLRFLYNDDIRWTTSIFEYVVNGMGEVERNRLFEKEEKEQQVSIMPEFRYALQISSNAVIAASPRNSQMRLVKITY